jgi:XTP/dITP diphosphohydrolase
VADDSGLVVEALRGAPGVRSKRWSGRADLSGPALDEANNRKLVESVQGLSRPAARYVCVAAYRDGERELVARGETAGEIVTPPRGRDGFGYDPYFLSAELGRTFGESATSEKEAVSHRGRAFRALIARLAAKR